MSGEPLLVPVKLDAFVLNPKVCGTGDDNGARIIPITQPNYSFLRTDGCFVQADVQDHADLQNTAPPEINPRLTDLGVFPPVPHRHRHGVYLHWILPRAYRAGIYSSDSVPDDRYQHERAKRGHETYSSNTASSRSSSPEYLQPPTRWVVIRRLDMNTIQPQEAAPHFKDYEAWVIESDHLWHLNEIDPDVDLQVDMAPFIVGGDEMGIDAQAEMFIGRKTKLQEWREKEPTTTPPNISVLHSSNELFADFQLHNANVFSMLDNFQYDVEGITHYLEHAEASYYLLGWHWKDDVDPLWNPGQRITREERLKALFMTLNLSGDPMRIGEWLQAKDPARILCHGVMYGVKWDHNQKPGYIPADDFARRLKDQEAPALSVGTTPIDALISYCSARQGTNNSDPAIVARLEEDILAIDSLLHASDDGVDGQREAKDTVYNWNFTREQGGTHYYLGNQDRNGKPTQPDPDSIKALNKLNQLQRLLDVCTRAQQENRWNMFSSWWKYINETHDKDQSGTETAYRQHTERLAQTIKQYDSHIQSLESQINESLQQSWNQQPAHIKEAAMPFFNRARDPTILLGGIDSGWPSDYLNNVVVRLPAQLVPFNMFLPEGLQELIGCMKRAMPRILTSATEGLLNEFYALRPDGARMTLARLIKDPHDSEDEDDEDFEDDEERLLVLSWTCRMNRLGYKYLQSELQRLAQGRHLAGAEKWLELPAGKCYPQYHDTTSEGLWRDQWGDRQPWFPLYAEWEVEYTHIPFEYWSLDEQTARLSEHKQIRYGIKSPNGQPLYESLGTASLHDTRRLSGRTLILPQPGLSLAAKVQRLFHSTPLHLLDEFLGTQDRHEMLQNIHRLSYLSTSLSGFTDQLLTLAHGTHIKPEKRTASANAEKRTAVEEARYDDAGFTKENLELISSNSALTPMVSIPSIGSVPYCPFKPVTHGQFRFLKFNVIDKFGQALAAIDPMPRTTGPPPLYPCISDFFEPQMVEGTKTANTVIKDNEGHCEFIQIPPQINQNSRLNAEFVKRTAEDPDYQPGKRCANWRPVTEWENPVWGWIVAQYTGHGLQFFLPDGTFYDEVRVGGPNGFLETPRWMPFYAGPSHEASASSPRMDALLKQLKDNNYLKAFWQMIVASLDSMPPSPDAHSQHITSIVGKPLALVNMGWSLELDRPPLQNQATNAQVQEPSPQLVRPRNNQSNEFYTFQVKLGDGERRYDGLLGYFDVLDKSEVPTIGEEFNLMRIKTYFAPLPPSDGPSSPLVPITTETYPKFTPYWLPPFLGSEAIPPDAYTDMHNSQLEVFSAIIDPFTPVHAYSSFLPAKSLQLPSWVWQKAMNNMATFFHAGPLIIAGDVPHYDPAQALTTQRMGEPPITNVSLLPPLDWGEWNWLQPYDNTDLSLGEISGQAPIFQLYGLDAKGDIRQPAFQPGPYTAVEGFLQLRNAIRDMEPVDQEQIQDESIVGEI